MAEDRKLQYKITICIAFAQIKYEIVLEYIRCNIGKGKCQMWNLIING